MLRNDLDLVLHLGDYTYEYAIDGSNRSGPVPEGFEEETVDLRTYRLRHTLYKLDPDLQAVHAKFPFVVIWDDHEVANDYSGLAPEFSSPSPAFTARRAAAYQAYYEHMPIRASAARLPKSELRIYRRVRYGKLAELPHQRRESKRHRLHCENLCRLGRRARRATCVTCTKARFASRSMASAGSPDARACRSASSQRASFVPVVAVLSSPTHSPSAQD